MKHQTADGQGGIGDMVLAILVDVGLDARATK